MKYFPTKKLSEKLEQHTITQMTLMNNTEWKATQTNTQYDYHKVPNQAKLNSVSLEMHKWLGALNIKAGKIF